MVHQTLFLSWSSRVLGAKNQFSDNEPLFLSGLRPAITRLLTTCFSWSASFPLSMWGLQSFFPSLTLCYLTGLPSLTTFCTTTLLESICIWPVLDIGFSVSQASFSPVSAWLPLLQTLLWTMALHREMHPLAISPGSQKHTIATQQPFKVDIHFSVVLLWFYTFMSCEEVPGSTDTAVSMWWAIARFWPVVSGSLQTQGAVCGTTTVHL